MHVQEEIRLNGLESVISKYHLLAKRHKDFPNLVLLKYNQIESPMGEPVVQECRGLILDEAANWKVVSRPYDKFFNISEGHAATIDWKTAKVYEKLDGSLMVLHWYDGKWRVASSGSPDASGPVNNDSSITFADLFWQTWESVGGYLPEVLIDCPHEICFMFELMTPQNRVIVPHVTPRLVLHGVRICEHPYNECPPEPWAEILNVECVRSFSISTAEEAIAAAEALNPMLQEGFIVTDGSYRRVKVKSPQYVALHHMASDFSERRMIELVRANEGNEFLTYFPHYAPLYNRIKGNYESLVSEVEAFYLQVKDIPVQKDFAMKATKTRCPGALFALRAGQAPNVRDYLGGLSVQNLQRLIA